MKTSKISASFALLVLSALLLAACANPSGSQPPVPTPSSDKPAQAAPTQNPAPVPPSADNGQAAAPSNEAQANPDIVSMLKDEKNYDWVVYVKDSSEANTGSIKTTVSMDLKASNASGGIEGKYTGSATASSKSVNSSYGATATSDTKVGTVNFSLGIPLAPLAPDNSQGKEPLAPLTQPGDEPDFEGNGTFALSNPTGESQIQGMGVSVQKEHTSASSFPIHLSVKGATVRMTMTSPQGPIYFNGYIRGEGKK
jgi:hypothetical protein